MATSTNKPDQAFAVETLEAADPEAARLWHDLRGPGCQGTRPPHWLIVREQASGRTVGIAQYFRTFPPEDACGAVLVQPEALHTGAGEQLLRAMAGQALKDGIRNLGTLVSRDDHSTLDLLRQARAPIRISPLHGGLYVEIDLLTFAGSSQYTPGRIAHSDSSGNNQVHRYQ